MDKLTEDQIKFCLGRIKSVTFMICEGDERCEELLAYILKDMEERLKSGENIYTVLDHAEKDIYYYIKRDYPDCKICEKAWRESFRTLRYCLNRQLTHYLQMPL